LSIDGSVFTAEMDAVLLLSFNSRKAGILTDLLEAIATQTIRITSPPIDCGRAIPL